jgi:transposase-like protein
LELRIAGYGSLAGLFELKTADRSPLLITAVRYFLSREIAEDLRLLRDLRYMRVELLSDALRTGFDRLADSLDRFTIVLSELLKELTIKNALQDEPTPHPAPDKPSILEPGFAILGEHLIAPIRTSDDGSRKAPCPVCLTNVLLTPSVGAWVSLSCASCGTEFQATDGTTAPPPPPPVFKIETTRKPPASQLAKNLQLWIDSGSPLRWIEYHKGMWDELEFAKLKDQLRGSHFWPLDLSDVRKILNEMAFQFRIKVTSSVSATKGKAATSSSGSHPLIKTSDVYRTIDGNLWVPCPLCRSFNVEIPPRSSGEVSLTCSGCWRMFLVDLRKKSAAILPPPASSTSVWRKLRNWFGS